jgi:hypothetical protein
MIGIEEAFFSLQPATIRFVTSCDQTLRSRRPSKGIEPDAFHEQF